MKATELFAAMPRQLAQDIVTYTAENEKDLYQAFVGAVAQARRVRPVFLQRMPKQERVSLLIEVLTRPQGAVAAENLLRTWLIKKHASVLCDFLDALKIPHQNGLVETLPEKVEDSALHVSVELLLGKYDAKVVGLYLLAFNHLNETHWPNLELLLQSEPRLKLEPD